MVRFLITGGAGFIGAAFVRYLLRTYEEAHVVTYDKLTYAGNLNNLHDTDPARHTFVQGDIADGETLGAAMADCDAVVNFAAESHVDRSIMGASDFIRTNIEGVNTLLAHALKLGIGRVLFVLMDEVYGSRKVGSFKEGDPLHPRNPYAAARRAASRLARLILRPTVCRLSSRAGRTPTGHISNPRRCFPCL